MTKVNLEKENKEIARQYKELLRISYQTLTEEDKKLIRSAFDLAVEAHKNQRRRSGEAYIFHPIAVAKVTASEIGLDATSIAAALLHEVVERTSYTPEDIKRVVGETVAHIVEGFSKITDIKKDANISQQAEDFRKLLLTLHDDIRVILIKIADRYHNMQTMDSMPKDKQLKKAWETLYVYAPLAHRIGLFNIKTQLEDLSLKYTEPEAYRKVLAKIQESEAEQEGYIDSFSNAIKHFLNKHGIEYTVKGRMKSIYSIHRKMKSKNISFDEVYDKFAVRIIYKSDIENEKFIAWKIYSVITDHFVPNPSRLRDWITIPRPTGYEALHTTVVGPRGKWVEVQIRSERMNEIAEKGYAAHFKYKHGDQKEQGMEEWLNRLQEAIENADGSASSFVEAFKLENYVKEIYVFTPQGDLKCMPKGATPLDFAFQIHTEVGLKTRGARINGKLMPLGTLLQNGDRVEILTSKTAKPSYSWLNYAFTAKARSKIKSSLKEEKKNVAEEGKETLQRKLKSEKITLNEENINKLVNFFKLKTSLDLFYRIGLGIITNENIKSFVSSYHNTFFNFFKKRIRKPSIFKNLPKEKTTTYDQVVFGEEEDKLDYKPAPCCNPMPGDPVFGFLNVSGAIKVHKKNCPNAISLTSKYPYRIMQAKWIDPSQEEISVTLHISGVYNVEIMAEITKIISDNAIGLQKINFEVEAGRFKGKMILKAKNNTLMKKVITLLKHLERVEKVTRI